jgi:trimethylamine--corrinoid protein Co-methyltransferase
VGDEQLGHEKTFTALLPALAGANLIYGAGMIESGVTFDCAQLVVDNEIAKMTKFAVRGIAVNDETLMVEDIAEVGSDGDFLSMNSTLRLMRSQTQPTLIDRRVRGEWETAGSSDLYARAKAKARQILSDYSPEPLDADVAAQIRGIVADADRVLAGVEPVHV